METPDRAFLTKSSRMIVGEIVNTLRAQANPSGTDDHISTDETSPVISGKYAIVPSISIGIMDYGEFFDVIGGFYEESGINNSGQHPWNTIGAVGLDAIFTPYTTESVLSKSPFLPRFTIPSGSEQVTSETLNPFNPFNSLSGISYSGNSVDDDPWFSGGHNISMALSYNPYDSGVDGSGGFVGISGIYPSGSGSPISYFFEEDHFARHTVETTSIRGVGLKSPMVLSGWGYDTDGNPVPSSGNEIHPEASWNPSVWKSGPVDLRWDETRGVWTGGTSTKIYLVKMTNVYNPPNFSYEVDRSRTRSQYSRNSPSSQLAYSSNQPIYDPEYVAYTGNPLNSGVYEILDYHDIEFPFYEAFIIRQTSDSVSDASYYNTFSEDCQDCGHISNPCPSGRFPMHGSSGVLMNNKKILIENPLRQMMDVGDLAFTVDTGRRKKVNTNSFIGGSGSYASGNIITDSSGNAQFVVTNSGNGYIYGGFAVLGTGCPCVGVSLNFSGGELTGGTISPSGGLPRNKTCSLNIYPLNATIQTESLPIHWIIQSEFKTQQVVTHVECDGGLMQTCSVKIQTQGFKTCESCGEDTALINSF